MFTFEEWEDMEENYAAVQAYITEWLTAEEYDVEYNMLG